MLLLPPEQRNLANKYEILKLGRPTPKLTKSKSSSNIEMNALIRLKLFIYQNYTWITECPALNKTFCWPCLFFNYFDKTNPWSNSGFDISKLDINTIKTHESTLY
jgi:hypothetical protein